VPALGNRFALDDSAIVERNAAAHSIAAGVHAIGHPYWPPEHGAGLWRPLVILSFGVEWQLTNGNPAVMHGVNVALHAVAAVLVVLVIAAYVTPAAALAGGVLFAIHPVHVEAVANLVGRAELLCAIGLMAAMLFARVARRRRASSRSPFGFSCLTLLSVLMALLSKEHAAVAVALLWLDDRADPQSSSKPPWSLLAAVVALTVAWLIVRRVVEGGLSFEAVAPTFFQLSAAGRVFTMLPAVLVLMRLMVFPFDLSPDYHPQVVDRLEYLTAPGVIGALLLAATIALSLLAWRKHRPAALGLMIIGVAWLPTSNFLFPTGIVLAERTLYLATVGVALLAAVGADALINRAGARRAGTLMTLAALPLAWTTFDRIPVWKSTQSLVIASLLAHPESYKVHQSAARVYWRLGLREQGLAQYHVAAELYGLDHYLLAEMGSAALETNHLRDARSILLRAERLDSNYLLTQQLLAQVYLRIDSPTVALVHARHAVRSGPDKAESARMLAASFLALGQNDSALAVWPAYGRRGGNAFDRWLLAAVTWAAVGQPDSAKAGLARAGAEPQDTIQTRRFREARLEVQRLSQGRP
jgi:hypothetical protein